MKCKMDYCRFRKDGECTKEKVRIGQKGDCLDFEAAAIGFKEEDYERMKKLRNLIID